MQLTMNDVFTYATTLAGGRADWSMSEKSFWANQAAVEVFNQVVHTPLEQIAYSSTSSGEQRMTLPSDFDAMISLSNLSSTVRAQTLEQFTGPWVDSQLTAAGTPTTYVIYGDTLELWPPPDSAYSLQMRYHAKQPVMIDSSSTPRFDERWHPGWLYKTATLLELSRNNPEGASVQQSLYLSYMNSIPSDRAKKQMAEKGRHVRYPRSWDDVDRR